MVRKLSHIYDGDTQMKDHLLSGSTNKRTQQTHATTQRFFSADLAPVIILTPICGGVHGTFISKVHYVTGRDVFETGFLS